MTRGEGVELDLVEEEPRTLGHETDLGLQG